MKPNACQNCPCFSMGTDFTTVEVGERYDKSRLLCIGEASGAAEAQEGLPFRPYAASGSLFSDALRAVGLSRSDVAITNILRCRPKNDWLEGAPYQAAAISQCTTNYLAGEIERLKPRAILALGGTAMRALTDAGRGKAFQLEYLRGYARPGVGIAEGISVVATFHPAFARRGAAHLIPLIQRDLLRAFRIATGKYQPILDPMAIGLQYQTVPSVDEAWEFVRNLDPGKVLSFDLETPMSTRSDEDDRVVAFTDRDIKLAQLTQVRGAGIAFPYREEFIDVVKAALAKCPIKVGFNNWNFDDPVLMANGVDAGETNDAMVMFHAYHPDLPANLQAAAQFCGFGFPWKHYASDDLAWYGVADVDAALCVYEVMKPLLEREGLAEFYQRYFHEFWPILRDMARRGLPISEERRVTLREQLETEDIRLDEAVRAMVPREVLTVKQKKGLKRAPKSMEGMKEIEVTIEKEEKCACLKKERSACGVCGGTGVIPTGQLVKRWAAEVEFNPNSSQQVKAFIRYLGHPMPKHAKRTDIATGEASDTTEVKELERLFERTKHPLYPLLIEKRQVSKLMGTYVEGWKPGRDGRVHTTFSFKPATLQTSSKGPNIQNGLKHATKGSMKERMAKAFNGMQCAEPGHVMMNFDLKSFHAQTLACEAGDADYLRLAKIDVHSFVACHFIRHPERHNLLKMSDADLGAFFKMMKKDSDFKFIRDFKAKRAILGLGFSLGYRKLYQMNKEDFKNEAEAKALVMLIMEDLFPKLKRYQVDVKALAVEQGFLQNKFGAIRRFYDVQRWDRLKQKFAPGDQAEAAVAFLPSSSAFGHIRDIMHRIRAQGWDEKYQCVNSIHDSLVYHCPEGLVDECVANIRGVMEAPSKVLVYAKVAPGGLSVEAEALVGRSLAEMEEWKN